MGTSVQVQAFGGDEATRRAAIDEAFAAFAEVDRLMSNYRDDSELSLINRRAAHRGRPRQRSDVRRARRRTRCQRGVKRRLRHHGRPARATVGLPRQEAASFRPPRSSRRCGRSSTIATCSSIASTTRSALPGRASSSILGGIAKGFAVEIAANVLRRRGLGGFIDAGGNQYLLGTPPGKRAWTIGIKNPDVPDRVLGRGRDRRNLGVHVGGLLQLPRRRRPEVRAHPRSRTRSQPSTSALSVTILSRDGTLADAMSKAAFILGAKAGLALVDSFPGMSAVIAYRKTDGKIGLALSEHLRAAFRSQSAVGRRSQIDEY